MDPFFDPIMLAWIERGGMYAIAHVHGGGVRRGLAPCRNGADKAEYVA